MLSSDIGIVFCTNAVWNAAWERFHQFAWMFGKERKTFLSRIPDYGDFNQVACQRLSSNSPPDLAAANYCSTRPMR